MWPCPRTRRAPRSRACARLSPPGGENRWGVCPVQGDYEKCNLLEQNCTEAGDGCYYSGLAGFPICQPAGDVTAGACGAANDCAKGYDCFANGTCFKICDINGGEPKCDSEFANCAKHSPPQSAGVCQE